MLTISVCSYKNIIWKKEKEKKKGKITRVHYNIYEK